jgi:DNA (cytosine-5)-methyltransferase 1
MGDLGYTVEWQVVNAADYGFPQRRRRVFIVGLLGNDSSLEDEFKKGVIGEALPFTYQDIEYGVIEGTPWEISEDFNKSGGKSPFANRGVLHGRQYITGIVKPVYDGKTIVLGDVLEPLSDVPDDFLTDPKRWEYTKGAKDEERIKSDGFRYRYKEGAVPFPDALDKPARTILTSEGGSSPSRTTHCILQDGKYRRLTPKELERLNGFPDDWTKNMNLEEETTNTMRGFLMGNALVIGIIEKIGEALEKRL